MKTVSLANQTRTILVLNFPHDVVPELSTRAIVGTREHNPTTGDRSVRAHRKKVSGSVTLLPKGTPGDIVRGLPFSVLEAVDVQRALRAWPPKIAVKVLEDRELAAETQDAADRAKKEADAQKKEAELRHIRALKQARNAGADVEIPSPAPTPSANGTKSSRVARGGAKE